MKRGQLEHGKKYVTSGDYQNYYQDMYKNK